MKIYKDSNNLIWFGNTVYPSGTLGLSIDGTSISIWKDKNETSIYTGDVTNIQNESGVNYSTVADFLTECADFFVKASGGGGIDKTYAKKTTQITHITIASGSWALSSGLYEASYSNVAITASNYVDVIPENSTIDIVKAAELLPKTVSSAGIVKLYAKNAPTGDITLTINIYE